MKQTTANFIIDLFSLIVLLGLVFTGLIMKYILPPGTGGLGRAFHGGIGGTHIKRFLSMSRHQWGSIHFGLAVAFILLMLLHIILHWAWIKNCFKSFFVSSCKER